MRDFEINIAEQDVEEQALIYITGYVAHRFQHKYPDLGTPTKFIAPRDDGLSCISRGNCLYPSDEFMEAARVMNAEFLSFHRTSFFNLENKIFDKVAKKICTNINNKFPVEVIACLVRTRSYIRLRHINNKIENNNALKKNAKKTKKFAILYLQHINLC